MTKEELKNDIRLLIQEFGRKETYQEKYNVIKTIWVTLLTGKFKDSDKINLIKDMRMWILNFQLYEFDKSKFGSPVGTVV